MKRTNTSCLYGLPDTDMNNSQSTQPILYYLDYDSPLGLMRILGSTKQLYTVYFVDPDDAQTVALEQQAEATSNPDQCAYFGPITAWLDRYFSNPHGAGPLPLDIAQLEGTPWQKTVWAQLAKIPSGQTISYSTLAQHSQRPRAIRAAASACGKNPIAILIPCHRVIAKSGQLGGYRGGLHIKKALLDLEKTNR